MWLLGGRRVRTTHLDQLILFILYVLQAFVSLTERHVWRCVADRPNFHRSVARRIVWAAVDEWMVEVGREGVEACHHEGVGG